MLSFRKEDRGRVVDGEITVTFRLWKTPKVKAGKRYATNIGTLEIETVEVLPAALVPRRDVKPSGCANIEAIWELAGEHTHTRVTPDTMLYRVAFRYLGDAPVEAERTGALADDELSRRLQAMDRRSTVGAWTERVLRSLQRRPHTAARLLAAEFGWPTLEFKARVRRLKALGLTTSHDVGYELAPAGRRYLRSLDKRALTARRRSVAPRSRRTRARSR